MLTITLSKYTLSDFTILPCPICGTVTSHALTKKSLKADESYTEYNYVCGCGNSIKVELKEEN